MSFILPFPIGGEKRLSQNQGQTSIEWLAQLSLHCLGPDGWLINLIGTGATLMSMLIRADAGRCAVAQHAACSRLDAGGIPLSGKPRSVQVAAPLSFALAVSGIYFCEH